MKRMNQILLIGSFLGFSWLAMQAVHESGHVLSALLSGGTITKVVLYPLTFSRTDVYPNPHPLFVVWSGPMVGAILPLVIFIFATILRLPCLYLFRFFAGFCLIVNGLYIGLGSFYKIADAGYMIRYGSSMWQLILFGILTVPVGFYLWNGLGPKFGFGKADGKVSRTAILVSLFLFIAIAGTEFLLGYR